MQQEKYKNIKALALQNKNWRCYKSCTFWQRSHLEMIDTDRAQTLTTGR